MGDVVVRGGTMAAVPLQKALEKSLKTHDRYALSVQVIPSGDHEAQSVVCDHLSHYRKACFSTPDLVQARGLELVHAPYDADGNHQGDHHYDLLHRASRSTEGIGTIVNDYQSAFFGPEPLRSVNCEWTTEDLRRFQQPS